MLLSVVITTRNRPDDLRALLESLQASILPPDEIVVIDDYQAADVLSSVRQDFPQVIFHRLPERGYITTARNTGWHRSQGELVFFLDDDNVVAPDCLGLCVEAIQSDLTIGVVGTKTMYHADPERITAAGTNLGSLALARALPVGLNEMDGPQYQTTFETDVVANAFLVRRSLLESTGGFDEQIVQTWSEADFTARVRQQGYWVLMEGKAKVWHRSKLVQRAQLSSRHVGGSPFRVYYLIRNRYVYVARYGRWWERLLFTVIFGNLYVIYYMVSMLREGRFDLARATFIGTADGLRYMVGGKLRQHEFEPG
jgi:GT2 family glycosyltransferase